MKTILGAAALAAVLQGASAGGSGTCSSVVKQVKYYASKAGNKKLAGAGDNNPTITSLDDVKYRPACDEDVTFRLPVEASGDVTALTFKLEYGHAVEGGSKVQGWSWHQPTGPEGTATGGTANGGITMEAGSQGTTSTLSLTYSIDGPEFVQGSHVNVVIHWTGKLSKGETMTITYKMHTKCKDDACTNPPPPSSTFDSALLSVVNQCGLEESSSGQQDIKAKIDCDAGGAQDPHIYAYNGHSYYFDGKAGHNYAFIHDKDVSLNIGVAPRYADGSAPYSDIVSAGMVFHNTVPGVADHRVAILHAAAACAAGVADACSMPAFGVVTMLDGDVLPLGMVDKGDIQVAVVEMPHYCKIDPDALDRDYGMTDDLTGDAVAGRSLRGADLQVEAPPAFDLKEWIATGRVLGAPSKDNDFINDCSDFLATHDVFGRHTYGELTTIMVRTATVTLRVEHWSFLDAALHEAAFGKPVAVGAVPLMLNIYPQDHWRPTETAHGLLGQTVRPLAPGQASMEGEEEDYRVDSLFATNFKFYP